MEEKTRINWWDVCNGYCDCLEIPICTSAIMLLELSDMSSGVSFSTLQTTASCLLKGLGVGWFLAPLQPNKIYLIGVILVLKLAILILNVWFVTVPVTCICSTTDYSHCCLFNSVVYLHFKSLCSMSC